MGKLAKIERTAWQILTGSSSWNYEQALWRPTRQPIDTVPGWSDRFAGDPETGGINRRAWQKVGVIAVRGNQLERLLAQENVTPAVAFTMGKLLVVGRLEAPDSFGAIYGASGKQMGHGMRIGNDETQFSVGVVDGTGAFVSPAQEHIDSQGPINVDDVGALGSAYQMMHFS